MNTPVESLLRWRLEKARTNAPPPPSAARLLALARPWWETSPERFQLAMQRLISIPVTEGDAVLKSFRSGAGGPVPALMVRTAEVLETSARILPAIFSNGRARLSFCSEAVAEPDEQTLEVTFVSASTLKPLFSGLAAKSLSGDYWLDAELSSEFMDNGQRFEANGPLAFRLILRPVAAGV
jgi:hypothetical protein